jgi:negative regulator of replication initiation
LELLLKEDVDQPYKLDEKKRSLLKELDKLNRSNKLQKAIEEWEESKLSIEAIKEDANPSQKEKINQIIATEKELLNSGDYYWIKRMIKELNHLFNEIYYSIDKNYVSVFLSLRNMDLSYYTNPDKALKLFDNGEKALLDQNYSLVREISYYLLSLIDKEHLKNDEPALKAIIGIK